MFLHYLTLFNYNDCYQSTQFVNAPLSVFISPSKADIKELFPEPTEPTTATSWPSFTCMLMSLKLGVAFFQKRRKNKIFAVNMHPLLKMNLPLHPLKYNYRSAPSWLFSKCLTPSIKLSCYCGVRIQQIQGMIVPRVRLDFNLSGRECYQRQPQM